MKRTIIMAVLLFTLMFGTKVNAEIKMNYVQDNMTTSADAYSLAGYCDPAYPLYINGKKIDVTKEGYFCYYADLQAGANVFNFDNTTVKRTYTINKKSTVSSTAATDSFKPVTFVGEVNMDNPTVRSRPDEANDDLITPYVKGTLVYVTAENSEYYKTSNYAYLYKSAIDKTDKVYGTNNIKSLEFKDNEIIFDMDRATEYAIALMPDGIKIILYDSIGGEFANPDPSVFRAIKRESFGEKASPAYTLFFKDQGKYIGYRPVFENGKMKIALNEKSVVEKNSLKGTKIVLDAGHGGEDAGTLGLGNVYEKTVTLAITNYLKDYLTQKGAEVILTRTDDTYMALGARTAVINEAMPDIAVSIHCNSRNEWENFGEAKGTLDLYTYDSTSSFVEKISESIGAPYEKSNLALTRVSACPAVLIETGYMSNPEEYAYLVSEGGQKELAIKIGQAIEKYFE